MNTIPTGHAVGYSILRTGEGDAFEACVVLPHVDTPSGLVFDAISRRMDVRTETVALSLPEIPADVAKLLTRSPAKVILVTTDGLSAIRSSARADALLSQLQ
jgi:hypothetical protein